MNKLVQGLVIAMMLVWGVGCTQSGSGTNKGAGVNNTAKPADSHMTTKTGKNMPEQPPKP